MDGMQIGAALAGNGRLTTDRPWVRWGGGGGHHRDGVLGRRGGAFAPDGIIAALVPLTTVIWILAQAATLPRSWRAATGAS
jgi:hypothetical protein